MQAALQCAAQITSGVLSCSLNPLKWECEAYRQNFPTMNINKIYKEVYVLRADALHSLTQIRHDRHIKVLLHQVKQDRQCTYKRNIEESSQNHCCSAKARNTTYSERVSVVVLSSMQSACAVLSSVAYPATQHFLTSSHKRHDFREKGTNIKCVF